MPVVATRERSDQSGMVVKRGEKPAFNGLVVKQEEKSDCNGPGKQEMVSDEQWMAAVGPPAVPGSRFPNGSKGSP